MNCLIVSATKTDAKYFSRATLLGQSLELIPKAIRPRLLLAASNSGVGALGLSTVYNKGISEAASSENIVFCHDDVFIHDWNICERIEEGLKSFDLIGVVGAQNVPWGQPGWCIELGEDQKPRRNLEVRPSGVLNHFSPLVVKPEFYGEAPSSCDLLDGLLIAARVDTLRKNKIYFDEMFKFHCYDSDICYQARSKGLSVGTWPIACTHGSGGNYGNEWCEAARLLMKKVSG